MISNSFLFKHLAILFNTPSKPGACWSCRGQDWCEELILTVGTQCDQEFNPGSFTFELNALAIEPRYPAFPLLNVQTLEQSYFKLCS